jgi:hypothetical protein
VVCRQTVNVKMHGSMQAVVLAALHGFFNGSDYQPIPLRPSAAPNYLRPVIMINPRPNPKFQLPCPGPVCGMYSQGDTIDTGNVNTVITPSDSFSLHLLRPL